MAWILAALAVVGLDPLYIYFRGMGGPSTSSR
jgi:hypothetical protein